MLTDVLSKLHRAAETKALDLSCVADTREITLNPDPQGVSPRIRGMLEAAGGDLHMTKDGGGLRVFVRWSSSSTSAH